MGINWQEGAVCFADGEQWFVNEEFNNPQYQLSNENSDTSASFNYVFGCDDFQLNTIKEGDYIEASELDTEQKYNDVVEVFGLFGFFKINNMVNESNYKYSAYSNMLAFNGNQLLHVTNGYPDNKRKLTYPQVMAIGELKRLEIERDKKEASECFVETLDEKVSRAEKLENEWTDKHYNFNYQLTQEDIEKGHVRVDAYFVNRMWKINQWDDTGAAFHVLKTLPRIANNKNPLKRELVALKKQVDLLCKMHGVDDEELK